MSPLHQFQLNSRSILIDSCDWPHSQPDSIHFRCTRRGTCPRQTGSLSRVSYSLLPRCAMYQALWGRIAVLVPSTRQNHGKTGSLRKTTWGNSTSQTIVEVGRRRFWLRGRRRRRGRPTTFFVVLLHLSFFPLEKGRQYISFQASCLLSVICLCRAPRAKQICVQAERNV